jgi:signal peptidase I
MTETTEQQAVNHSHSGKKSTVREYAEAILWAIAIAFLIRTWVVQPFTIPSGSMEDTLVVGDHLLANKFLYGIRIPFTDARILKIRDPRRGDVIIFKYPEDRSKDFIKRVIGVPGDEILIRNKQVFVNGVPYRNPREVHKEPLVLPREQSPRDTFGPLRVPAGSWFVMGDNRDRSYDSRFWGFVRDADIVGSAFVMYWSWDGEKWRVRWERIGRRIE